MIKTKGLAHFTIPVTDTVRSMAFYADILGMTPIQVNHDRGMVFLDTGGDCVILAKSEARVDPEDHDVHHAFITRTRRKILPPMASTCSSRRIAKAVP